MKMLMERNFINDIHHYTHNMTKVLVIAVGLLVNKHIKVMVFQTLSMKKLADCGTNMIVFHDKTTKFPNKGQNCFLFSYYGISFKYESCWKVWAPSTGDRGLSYIGTRRYIK